MASELIERIVIPFLDKAGVDYDEPVLPEDDFVSFRTKIGVDDRPVEGTISVYDPISLISIYVYNITRFQPNQRWVALDLINNLNSRAWVGKYILDDDLDLAIKADLCVSDESRYNDLYYPFTFLMSEVSYIGYPATMRVIYGNQSVEDAMRPQSEKLDADPAWKDAMEILNRVEDDPKESDSSSSE